MAFAGDLVCVWMQLWRSHMSLVMIMPGGHSPVLVFFFHPDKRNWGKKKFITLFLFCECWSFGSWLRSLFLPGIKMQVYVYLAIVVPDWPRAKWDIDMGNLESLGSEAD